MSKKEKNEINRHFLLPKVGRGLFQIDFWWLDYAVLVLPNQKYDFYGTIS